MSDPFSKDWFPSAEDANPVRAAQVGMKPTLPKRFYREAGVEEHDGAFRLVLDGKPAPTPAGRPLSFPKRVLAQAVASEWSEVRDEIDPAAMPITRLVNTVIDGVSERRPEIVEDLVRFAGSDLVCYRAGEPVRLAEEQEKAWAPVLAYARECLGARFDLAEGVMHISQPAESLGAIRAALEQVESPFALGALHVMTTLTGSVLVALAHAGGVLGADEAWSAAHVDERFQESVWGADEEAQARRAQRWREFEAASIVYRLTSE
jgi:chaperone required for assembly of F1-ATPase